MRQRLPHYDNAADLVRAVSHANRVDLTHVRLLIVHTDKPLDALEKFLGNKVLTRAVALNTSKERWIVEAFACQIAGIAFHALTFSLGPEPGRQAPHSSTLEAQDPTESAKSIGPLEAATWQVFDTARRPTSIFRGITRDEYLIQFPPQAHHRKGNGPPQQLLAAALRVTDLAYEHGRPIEYTHAPAVAPSTPTTIQDLQRSCLRFELAFPRFDDSGRLDFGAELVDHCCMPENRYGLSQRAILPRSTRGYWDEVVPLSGDADNDNKMLDGEVLGRYLAITCIGPERLGTLQALLRILATGQAPLLGISSLTLDGIDIIHLLTRASPRDKGPVAVPDKRMRADVALSWVLDQRSRAVVDDRLRDYRLVASTWDEKQVDPARAALWLTWQTPATSDALRLTLRTLRVALDDASTRHANAKRSKVNLSIDYLACRASTSDRLNGRMRMSLDLSPFRQHNDYIEPSPDDEGGVTAARQLGRFRRDVRHQWRQLLSLALGTPYIEAQVVWHESWLRHPTSTGGELQDDGD